MASDLDLHCLLITLFEVSQLKWVMKKGHNDVIWEKK